MAILYAEDRPEATFYVYELINIIQSLIGKVMFLNYPEELKDLNFNNIFIELSEEGWNNWK